MAKDVNLVSLKGYASTEPKVILDDKENPVKSFVLKCKRFSGFADEIDIHLPFTFDRQINSGDAMEINGQFRSYNKEINGTRRLVLYVQPNFIEKLDFMLQDENYIKLQGTLCKKPIYRKTPLTDREITDFMIAVNRPEGETDYVPCIAWGYNALALKDANVGDKIALNGRIQTREYKKVYEDGREEKRTACEISCVKLHFEKNIDKNSKRDHKKDHRRDYRKDFNRYDRTR